MSINRNKSELYGLVKYFENQLDDIFYVIQADEEGNNADEVDIPTKLKSLIDDISQVFNDLTIGKYGSPIDTKAQLELIELVNRAIRALDDVQHKIVLPKTDKHTTAISPVNKIIGTFIKAAREEPDNLDNLKNQPLSLDSYNVSSVKFTGFDKERWVDFSGREHATDEYVAKVQVSIFSTIKYCIENGLTLDKSGYYLVRESTLINNMTRTISPKTGNPTDARATRIDEEERLLFRSAVRALLNTSMEIGYKDGRRTEGQLLSVVIFSPNRINGILEATGERITNEPVYGLSFTSMPLLLVSPEDERILRTRPLLKTSRLTPDRLNIDQQLEALLSQAKNEASKSLLFEGFAKLKFETLYERYMPGKELTTKQKRQIREKMQDILLALAETEKEKGWCIWTTTESKSAGKIGRPTLYAFKLHACNVWQRNDAVSKNKTGKDGKPLRKFSTQGKRIDIAKI